MRKKSSAGTGARGARQQSLFRRFAQAARLLLAAIAIGALGLVAYALLIVLPGLPSVEALLDYQPKMPLRVYTADNVLIGEFGEERRDFVPIKQMPAVMKKALIAIEDDRFYEHGGVDYTGIARAAVANLSRSRSQGGSTITMQVARTFFLTRQKTYSRKIQEIMLAYKIENKLSKDQILELYMNQIYLGERAYGFGTAARMYFGKPVGELTIAEAAMLAGLPKAPGTANPVVNPARAKQRQQYVLKRMYELGYINDEQFQQATQEKLVLRREGRNYTVRAEYAAELVRQYMYSQFKEDIYTSGHIVHTTLNSADQNAAYQALRRGVLDYDRRHGYRGAENHIALPTNTEELQDAIEDILLKHPQSGDMQSAVVIAASAKLVKARLLSGETLDISGDGLRFAASTLPPAGKGERRIRPGSVIRVMQDAKKRWSITQLPEVSAALVSMNANDGSYRAMVGGFDFNLNKFDHVSQAWRQPGSSIKPFIYSAALEKGFSPGTIINDEPFTLSAADAGGKPWEPQNDDGTYDGAVTMRTGLKKSKNLVSIRVLQAISPTYGQQYLTRFGFGADRHPANLTLTLGTGTTTPAQLAAAYTVFANGGYKVTPYVIQRVTDAKGKLLIESKPVIAGDESNRVIDPRNAFIIDSMLRDVVTAGTGAAASQRLGRRDLAGKTGTTNDAVDGWFAGYGGDVVAVAWMGYDKPRSLGGREFGGTVALPIWIDYMRETLRGRPLLSRLPPAGLTQVDGDWAYQEYQKSTPVPAPVTNPLPAVVEEVRSFWDRLFGSRPQPVPQAPAPQGAPQTFPYPAPVPSPRPSGGGSANEDIYRGG